MKTEVFTSLPGRFRVKGRNEWTAANRGGASVECFLEGPCFDRDDLYFTDQGQTGCIDPTGRVFRLRTSGAIERLADNVPGANGITLNGTDRQVYVAAKKLYAHQ